MIAVDQTMFYDKGEVGNCVQAVTASILELKLEDVPHFVKDQPGSDWYETWENFMMTHRGKKPIMLIPPWEKPPIPIGYYLASGNSERNCKHIVIMYEGNVVHDPHPSKVGLLDIEAVFIV